MDWLGPALVFYVAVAATLIARRRLAHIAALRLKDAAALVRAVRSSDVSDLRTLQERADDESFEQRVVAALLEEGADGFRVAAVNEHLGDLDRALEAQRDVPRVIGRGALLCGTLACVLGLTLTVTNPTGPAWAPAAVSFLLGIAGFVGSLQIDRRARDAAAATRAEWDKVAAALGERLNRRPTGGEGRDPGLHEG